MKNDFGEKKREGVKPTWTMIPIQWLDRKKTTVTKIFHLSDIHIRLYQRLHEYEEVFEHLYDLLAEEKTQLVHGRDEGVVVVTGDLLHNKNELSPECIATTQNFLRRLVQCFPVLLIAGNHDALLNNKSRMDSITAILGSVKTDGLWYLRDSGFYGYRNLVFGVSSLLDGEFMEISRLDPSERQEGQTLVALYHGGVGRFSTNMGFSMEGHIGVSRFDGYDLTLLGDIHLYQYLNADKTMAYPGSLISQNFTETDENHGFLVWTVATRQSALQLVPNRYAYCDAFQEDEHHLLFREHRYDLREESDLAILSEKVPDRGRMNLCVLQKESTVAQIRMKSHLQSLFPDLHIQEKIPLPIKPSATTTTTTTTTTIHEESSSELDPTRLLEEYLRTVEGMGDEERDTLMTQLIGSMSQEEKQTTNRVSMSGSSWQILRLEFSHMFGYGPDNVVDFTQMPAHETVGVFGENSAGKSSLIEILCFLLYGKITRYKHGATVPREVIHFHETQSSGRLLFRVHGTIMEIYKTMTLSIKTQKIQVEEKLYRHSETGDKVDLSEEHRGKTDKIIEGLIGKMDEFLFTTVFLQQNEESFRGLLPSKRKEFLFSLLNLQRFELLFTKTSEDVRFLKRDCDREEKELRSLTTPHDLSVQQQTCQDRLTTVQKSLVEQKAIIQKLHLSYKTLLQEKKPLEETTSKVRTKQERARAFRDLEQESDQIEKEYGEREQKWYLAWSRLSWEEEVSPTTTERERMESRRTQLWTSLDGLFTQRVTVQQIDASTRNLLRSSCLDGLPLSLQDLVPTEKHLEQDGEDIIQDYQRWRTERTNLDTRVASSSSPSSLESRRERQQELQTKKEACYYQLNEQAYESSPYAGYSLKKLVLLRAKLVAPPAEEWEEQKVKVARVRSAWNENILRQQQWKEKLQTTQHVLEGLRFQDDCEACRTNKKQADLAKEPHRQIRRIQKAQQQLLASLSLHSEEEWTLYQSQHDDRMEKERLIQEVEGLLSNRRLRLEIQQLDKEWTELQKQEDQEKDQSRCLALYDEAWERLHSFEISRQQASFLNEHVDREIKDVRDQIHDLDTALSALHQFHLLRGQRESIVHRREDMVREQELFKRQETIREKNIQIDQELLILETQTREKEETTLQLAREESRLLQELLHLKTRLQERLHKETVFTQHKTSLLQNQRLLSIVGQNGFPMYLLDRYVPYVEKEINRLTQPFLRGKQVVFRNDKKKEVMSIYLGMHHPGQNSETVFMGGMEGFIVDAALKIIFSQMTLQPRCDLFMIDEGISVMDKETMDHLDEFFQFLDGFFPHVLIISHLREAREFVSHSIQVTKDPQTDRSNLVFSM